MPILRYVYRVLYENQNPRRSLSEIALSFT